jgi:hypothetical protein
MNRTLSYGAKLFAHLDPSKGVDAYRQQDGGHGSRNPLRSVRLKYDTHSTMLVHARALVSIEYNTGTVRYTTTHALNNVAYAYTHTQH